MILHASVTATDPRKTAQTIAALLGGPAIPFGPGVGTWTAAAPDPVGNIVEVLKRGSEFHRRPGGHVETRLGPPALHSGFHLLIETELSEAEVLELAAAQGFAAHRSSNGLFELIELWIDDCLLIEVVTPELARAYRHFLAAQGRRIAEAAA
jgi:hypothetical protein